MNSKALPPKGTWVSEGTRAENVGDFTNKFRSGGGWQGLIDINIYRCPNG